MDCFAICAPGLEPLVEAELTELSIRCKAVPGGVEWSGSESSLAIANLWSRIASRIVVRISAFRARSFFELERHAKKVEWERHLAGDAKVRFRVTARKSKLYHTGAIEQRLQEAVARRTGRDVVIAGGDHDDDETEAGTQLFVVRFERDDCVISADSSGALLHRRGYRQAVAKAPLRETLAAAMLRGAGWNAKTPLLDPMCGSGTIPIEAAMIARRIPPGLERPFAFLGWPGADLTRWKELTDHARSQVLARSPVVIQGSDRDAGAIEAARANAERAGVAGDATFEVAAVSAAHSAADNPGLLITNPPYGERLGAGGDVRNLFAQAGNTAREAFPGWTFAMLSPDKALDAQARIPMKEIFRTTNGGIPVRLVAGAVE